MTEQLLMVVGVTALCMLSPGPDMVLVMRNTLLVGRRAGGWTAAGVLTGNMVHIAYCALGLGILLTRSPGAYAVLRYASALYLAYLGLQNLKSRGEGLVCRKFALSSQVKWALGHVQRDRVKAVALGPHSHSSLLDSAKLRLLTSTGALTEASEIVARANLTVCTISSARPRPRRLLVHKAHAPAPRRYGHQNQ